MTTAQIETICTARNCTPNDLFEWQSGSNSLLPESHALRSLTRPSLVRNAQEMVRRIPIDKIEELLSEAGESKN